MLPLPARVSCLVRYRSLPLHCTVQATKPRKRLKVPSCVIAIQLVGFPRTVPSSAFPFVLQLSH
ncbi:hypothetical protein CGRA01v4_02562 [Colletotrichum graminicola]|nr:hypothetical protein CGRA01v4_02562 [Colletotrichum graminicola]